MHHASTRALLTGTVLLAGCLGCAHGDEPGGPFITDLEIVGNEAVDEGDIRERILTEGPGWIPFAARPRFDPMVWRTDLERIERYYRARGFYQAEVIDDHVEPVGEDAVKLTVRVREGEPTRITHLEVRGLDELPAEHREQVLERIGLREGDVFLEAPWAELEETLRAKLVALGYAEAEVSSEAKVDLATREASLHVEVTPGVRYRPGPVHAVVEPGARVEAWRVEEQVREAIEGEQWYSQEVAREAQERLFDMGVFGAAQVVPLPGNPKTQELPLRIEVAEAPFHEVAAGFGVGIEQRRQEGHVVAEYVDRDFLGGLRRLTLDATVGWAFIPDAWEVVRGGDAVVRSGPIAELRARLEQPRLFHPNVRLRTQVEVERAVEQAYAYIGGRAEVGVPWRPRTWLVIEPSYHLEIYVLREGTTALSGDAPDLLFGCEDTCVLSYLEQVIAIDRRDDPQEPTSGYYLALSLQEGGGPLGGSFDYLRVSPEARIYTPVLEGRRLTLAGRVRVGTLIPLRGSDLDSPVVARFFSGGDGMRGFSTQRLSPMRLVEKEAPAGPFTAEPVPVGGNGLFEASVEARYRMTPTLTVATFVDTGFVTSERVDVSRPSYFADNLLWAVGAGLRYQTPVGPVRLDLAYRLPFGPPLRVFDVPGAGLTYERSRGCFGIGRSSATRGGAPEGVCALHLSIGEAF